MLDRIIYNRPMRQIVLLVVGPIGAYALYEVIFVFRLALQSTYPALESYITPAGLALEAALCALACGLSIWLASRQTPPRTNDVRLPVYALMSLTFATAIFMAMTVYRVFGNLDLGQLAEQYDHYYQFSRNGGAWLILAGYGVIYILLIDMYRGGVNATNSIFLFVNIALNFTTGGRQLLLVCLIAYLFLLYFHKPKLGLKTLLPLGLAAVVMMGGGYNMASKIRGASELTVEYAPPAENAEPRKSGARAAIDPTSSYYTLNFNAAFVLNDVIRDLSDGSVSPAPHVLIDAMNLVPRFIKPSKPPSNSTTRSFYPEKGATGTTLSFPLKANLMAHFGLWAYFLDWIVVAAMQAAFIWGLFRRRLGALGFIAFFWGAAFSIVARDGILNAGNLVQTAVMGLAYLCYLVMMSMPRPVGRASDQAEPRTL